MRNFCLGVDLMGADSSPASIFKAVLTSPPDCLASTSIIFFATKEVIEGLKESAPSVSFCPCTQVIDMDDSPVKSVKSKTEATVVVGMKALKDGKIDAFLSCGNTGALVAASCLHLRTFPSVTKPALLSLFPSLQGEVVVLDVGALSSSTASQMVEHAFLGAAYARSVQGIERPTVALLNIGAEPSKGDEEAKKAWQKLSQVHEAPFLFVGNKEPQDLFLGSANVFVTPGFAGNIFLKTAEVTAHFVLKQIKEKIASHLSSSTLFDEVERELQRPMKQGAVVFGVRGLVIKCHGSADKESIQAAIAQAKKLHTQTIKRSLCI